MLGSNFDSSSLEQNLNNSPFNNNNNYGGFDPIYSDYTHSQTPNSFNMATTLAYTTLDQAGGVQHAQTPLPTAQMPPPPMAPLTASPSNTYRCDRCDKCWPSQTHLK